MTFGADYMESRYLLPAGPTRLIDLYNQPRAMLHKLLDPSVHGGEE
jgi:hypothetical protein